jgi:HTH-type transcriptional regulator / antitoxin HigA
MKDMIVTKELEKSWSTLKPLLAIKTKKDYEQAIVWLNELIDEVGTNEKHPLYDLLDTLGTVLHAYEEKTYKLPAVSGKDMLQHFMEEHELTQSDLPEIGSQGVVSEVLSGKRELKRQVQALAKRLGVASGLFFET